MKKPSSFFSAVVALTLGIGLVTFSLCAINCVFFGKLPFPDADRLVYATIPVPALRTFQEQQTTFEGLSAFSAGSANFKAIDAPSRRRVCFISANFLDVVRAQPMIGRGFLPGDDPPGAAPVALIGYNLWQREFQANPAAVGSVIRLDGQPRTIVGIMPKGFKFPIDDELWVPAEPKSSEPLGWGFGFGRLKPSVAIAEARVELNIIAARVAASRPPEMKSAPGRVGPFTRYLSDLKGPHGPGPGVSAMLFLTLLVLYIACANVAGLTFANATKRATELAVRGAMGATRGRLISQMLIESLILAASGAVGGVLVVASLGKWFDGWFAGKEAEFSQVPFWMHIQIDGRILLALVGLTFLTNLLAGLWPALQATKRDAIELLKAQTGGTSGIRIGKFQRLLVMVQIACSVVILTQSFVLLSFSQGLKQVDLPFDPASILTARIDTPASADPRSFYDELERNLTHLPGIQAVALSTSDPVSGYRQKPIAFEGVSYPRPEDHPHAGSGVVSAGFFHILNLPFLQGRCFTAEDVAGSMPVAIVNATFAKKFLPPGHPLGHRFRDGTNAWLTIVGCVTDLDYDAVDEYQPPAFFVPLAQQPARSMVISVHGNGRAMDWVKPLQAEVARLQPDLAIHHVATTQALMDHDTIGYYLASLLLALCGGGALFLATLGIFGLITFSVNQRTREIGVRLALGAPRDRIVRTLLNQVIRQIAGGLAVGALSAYGLNQLLTHSIAGYPTVGHSGWVYLATVAFLGTISLCAVLVPALRGARIEPMMALRYE
jgi:predicted permease